MITNDNWSSCFYKSPKLKAFISLGADPAKSGDPTIYILCVTDHEHTEIFSKDCDLLSEAISEINQRYKHWEFVDGAKKSDGGGCGSCVAH